MEMTGEKVSAAKQRILETALRLFYGNGIRATGVDTIIAESGVAKMTFYKHFPSKQLLVLAVLKIGGEIWMESLRTAIEKKKNPKDRLLAIFDFLAEWFATPGFRGCAFINTFSESSDGNLEECIFSAQHKRELENYIATLAKQAKLPEPNRLAAKLLLLIDGAIVRARMEGTAEPAGVAKSIAKSLVQ